MLRKICNTLSAFFMIVLLGAAGILLFPKAFGLQEFAVLSGSMMPEIKVGEIVFVKKTDAERLAVGDIITYNLGSSARVTHRIMEINEEQRCLITKGDANEAMDGKPVPFDDVVGRVSFHVPYLGYISTYIKTPVGILIACGVVMGFIILNFLPDILEERKRVQV